MTHYDMLIELVKTESNTEEICSSIVTDLKSGTTTILKLISTLRNLLISQEVNIRRGGIDVLSTVLGQLPESLINANELEHLVEYFCTCLVDHHSFIPAVLKGFLSLMKMDNVPDGVSAKIFSVLNMHFTCQSQPQADRFVCYQLLNTLMTKKPSELQALGPDFVCGYLSIIDSERDPRSLMYLFEHLPMFLQCFPPGHLLEDAFEAVSCYFPVDFRTNPKDPRGITREDLSNALMPCLTAIPDFCSSTIAIALDKLSSDLIVAKMDSLLLLKRCFSTFPVDRLLPLVTEIMSSLLNELKPGVSEAEVQELCIDVLSSLIKYLSEHEEIEKVTNILSTVYSSVAPFLNDIHLSYFTPAVKFVAKIASSCPLSCQYVITKILMKLVEFNDSCDADVKIILESFKLVLLPCVEFNFNCVVNGPVNLWFRVTQIFLKHCNSANADLKISSIEVLTSIVRLINADERCHLYYVLCENVKHAQNSLVRQKCVDSMSKIALEFPLEIKIELDSKFTVQENGKISDKELRKRIFHCWCSLAPINGFLEYLDIAVKTYITSDEYEYVDFVIQELRELLERETNNVQFVNSLHHEMNITRHLMDWWHEGCNTISHDVNHVFDNEKTAENLQFIICTIIRALDEQSQMENAIRYFQLTINYSKRFMKSFEYLNADNDLSMPKVHCSLSVITFESIVNALLPSVLEKTLNRDLPQIIKYLSTLAVYCSRSICCSVACRCIATIFNKHEESPSREEQIKYMNTFISYVIENKTNQLRSNAIRLLLYVTKSLLLQGYAYLNLWLDKVLVLVADKEVSHLISNGFRAMSTEEEYFLNAKCYCSVKLFYRQRLFSYVMPRLVAVFGDIDKDVKIQCAVSAVYLLEGLPQSVVFRYIKEIIPLLVELLDLNCGKEILLATLEKMRSLLLNDGVMFEEYVETFIPKLLILARDAANMKVRLASLQCLTEFSKLNPMKILSVKMRVVHELTSCLDDRKRLVRQVAVRARTRWIILGIS